MKYKYIIGLDLSLTEPGWAKYNVETKELTFGVIDVKKTKGMERIHLISEEVGRLVCTSHGSCCTSTAEYSCIKFECLVIIEGYSFASKGNSAISLGELGGVVRHMFYYLPVDYKEVAPTQLKKFVSGKGTSGKEIILRDIYKNFQIEVDNNNAADAIGLCYIGRTALGLSDKKVTIEQKKIADAVMAGEKK